MRSMLIASAVACFLAMVTPSRVGAATDPLFVSGSPVAAPVLALQIPDKKIEITVGEKGSSAWYRNPVWIAIGILAVVVILLIVVLIGRGGGTTIIRG
jgi:hypothetical protein